MKDDIVINLDRVSKSFGEAKVVDGVSFSVRRGEIFGLIGPNGSGKTTIIRMMLGILEADSGSVAILNGDSDLVGYLPEERGLYKDLTVEDTVGYFASLKGMDRIQAVEKANGLLLDLGQPLDITKKIKELSHGMAQLVQLVIAIVHGPDLVVLDEPFAGLDPVRCGLFRGIINKLNSEGKTVFLSTHRMEEVEALCERIFMINKGICVLHGGLKDIRERYSKGVIRVAVEGELGELNGVQKQYEENGYNKLVLGEGVTPEHVLTQLLEKNLGVKEFAIELPSLQEIFVDLVGTE